MAHTEQGVTIKEVGRNTGIYGGGESYDTASLRVS